MTNRNPEPSNRQLLILLGIFATIIGLIVWVVTIVVDVAIARIPPSVEQKLGALIVPIYEQQAKPSPQQDTLNQLLDRLEANLTDKEQKKRNYRVLYVPQPVVNAIAIPGDVVIIFEGLVKEVGSENELMMILGHELGHFAHRDHLRGLGRSLLLRIAIASIFGDTGTIVGSAGTAIETITNSKYSQSQEIEADEFGLMLLNRTYNHVAGATDFFQRLSKKEHLNWDFLASHPAPEKRVKHIKKLIQEQNYPINQPVSLPSTLKI